ncbi:MAG: M50 family metallopeptidase [Solirubrobacteraceae bacterium]
MSWVLTILGIMLLIVLHELGHFTVAKAVGMRVERFSLFFPPILLRVKRGETEYALGALPFGGYVKITGMNPEELEAPQPSTAVAGVTPGTGESEYIGSEDASAEEPPALDPEILRRAYYNQAPWKRIAVILAGPGVNIVIAFALFWAILFTGSLNGANALENLDPSVQTLVATTSVQRIERGAPADGVLRRGDRLLTVEGRRATVSSAQAAIALHRCAGAQVDGCRASTPVHLTVRRGGRVVALSVYPRYSKEFKRMLIGFDFGAAPKSFGALSASGAALGEMWHTTTETLTGFVHALTSSKARKQISSIIGITQDAHATVAAGPGLALVFLGYLSLILAVINLFPFLPLDGGHVLWALAEKLRGKRISLLAMYRYSSVGIVLLLFLVVNGIGNDIGRLGG